MKLTIPLLALLCVLALLTGSVPLSLADVVQVFMGGGDEMARFVVLESRLPQLVTALLAGAALSVSGLVMQTLFANPLADPALLGVNSGASLGAALALLLLGGSWTMGDTALAGVALTIVAAFVGACGVIALLTMCSHYLRGNLALLVVGVMLNFVLSAVI